MKPLENEYPVILDQNVVWGDMDAFGHVNNTVYFRYFEDARIAYFEKLGIMEHMSNSRLGPILASAQTQFRRPLDYPDRITIGTRSVILSPRKLRMEYAVFSRRQETVVAEGDGLIVYYDYASGRSCSIPETIVAAIQSMESALGLSGV